MTGAGRPEAVDVAALRTCSCGHSANLHHQGGMYPGCPACSCDRWPWHAHMTRLDLAGYTALLDRLAEAEVKVARVEALAEPLGSYHPYAVALDDDVIFAVALDDLRAALTGGDR